jgi:hypothetical protein
VLNDRTQKGGPVKLISTLIVLSLSLSLTPSFAEDHFTALAQGELAWIQIFKSASANRRSISNKELLNVRKNLTSHLQQLYVYLLHCDLGDGTTFRNLIDHRDALVLGSAETCIGEDPLLLPEQASGNLGLANERHDRVVAADAALLRAERYLLGDNDGNYNPCDPERKNQYQHHVQDGKDKEVFRLGLATLLGNAEQPIRLVKESGQLQTFRVLANRYQRLLFEYRKIQIRTEQDSGWLSSVPEETQLGNNIKY